MDKGKNAKTRVKRCGDCIHECACAAWNVGNLSNTDARMCRNYETAEESAPYFMGFMVGRSVGDNG